MTTSTMRELILWGEQQLNDSEAYFGHGTDNALDESACLMAYARNIAPDFPEEQLEQAVNSAEQQQFEQLIAERINKRIPAAYLTHQAWFTGLPFYVDERVLIPRSPIAELIMEGFSPWIDIGNIHDALDLCTGSGCIGIALAAHRIFLII